jgi:hypothetical protein
VPEEGKGTAKKRQTASDSGSFRGLGRLWGERIRYAGLRIAVVVLCVALIVLHALAPKGFRVDLTTVGLVVVVVAVLLEPLIESFTLPGGAGVAFRRRVDDLTEASAQFSEEAPTFQPQEQKSPELPEPAAEGDQIATSADGGRDLIQAPYSQARAAEEIADRVLDEASLDPRLGLMSIARELELEVNRLLAVSGWGQGRRRWPLAQAVDKLVEMQQLPASTSQAIRAFTSVRNLAVHGAKPPDEQAVTAAVLAGIDIYVGIASIPRGAHIVDEINIELYADEGLIQRIERGVGVALRNLGPDSVSRTVYPTTRDYFRPGDEVAWGWGSGQWEAAWYRDRESGAAMKAFDAALEFVGPPLRELGF